MSASGVVPVTVPDRYVAGYTREPGRSAIMAATVPVKEGWADADVADRQLRLVHLQPFPAAGSGQRAGAGGRAQRRPGRVAAHVARRLRRRRAVTGPGAPGARARLR